MNSSFHRKIVGNIGGKGKNITDTEICAKKQTKVSLSGMESYCDEKKYIVFLFL